MEIIYAESIDQIEEARKLFREYESFLNVDLNFQNFETELALLPGKYAPPGGALFLAVNQGDIIGCGALRRFDNIGKNVCEMKRLFVRNKARGSGAGKKLALRIIKEGIDLGYSTMVLDTLNRLSKAMELYQSIGFVQTKPYYENPLPDVVYWRKNLVKTG